ncbi:hypothetical protein [Cellulomonas shaoxiangyii]|uniref:Uncharacterized protein n=1 Tax=Cellulomonas shaoxiangyii TaxID=2566013 RepID=A0A4P7SL99_9CELL|nr:hypothetical protein [Cellulomonas shaoxiangyii]QCB93333.1 hypothetical protein E5225_06975 [Cellulomonas shaoxiangyii]TGY79438.1 hypothetical protein E5226_15505 [Cellulomonas shaoxiangyii]
MNPFDRALRRLPKPNFLTGWVSDDPTPDLSNLDRLDRARRGPAPLPTDAQAARLLHDLANLPADVEPTDEQDEQVDAAVAAVAPAVGFGSIDYALAAAWGLSLAGTAPEVEYR